MRPTILLGDSAAVSMSAYRGCDPERGNVIVFRTIPKPNTRLVPRGDPADQEPICYVKRIVGLPGDTVEMCKGGCSGTIVRTPFDSREHGTIARGEILGKVSQVYFSCDGEEEAVRWSRLGKRIQ